MSKLDEAILILANSQKVQTELLSKLTENTTSIKKESETHTHELKRMSGKMFWGIGVLMAIIILALINPSLIPRFILR